VGVRVSPPELQLTAVLVNRRFPERLLIAKRQRHGSDGAIDNQRLGAALDRALAAAFADEAARCGASLPTKLRRVRIPSSARDLPVQHDGRVAVP
jgi:hypothetical protein